MKTPTWISLLSGISVFALFYLATDVLIHRVYSTEVLARAIEAGIAGGTTLWLLARARWRKLQSSGR
jgi:uncharacterized PurR-regulated membrane protein YhhQ (DUF165 family)